MVDSLDNLWGIVEKLLCGSLFNAQDDSLYKYGFALPGLLAQGGDQFCIAFHLTPGVGGVVGQLLPPASEEHVCSVPQAHSSSGDCSRLRQCLLGSFSQVLRDLSPSLSVLTLHG